MSKLKPKLPKAGDTSNAAIGKRLEHARKLKGQTVAKAAYWADATPAQWRAWESGKTPIPPRNAWLVNMNIHGPVEWLLTGYRTEHPIPATLPALGNDLSGFAARVKEARQRLGFSIADVGRIMITPLTKSEWLQWEAAEDEPDYETALALASALEVSLEWLYSDTEASAKAIKPKARYQADLYVGPYNDFEIGPRLKAAREAAGLSLKDVALLTGRFLTAPKLAQLENGAKLSESAWRNLHHHAENYLPMLAMLYGVPLDTIMHSHEELTILRRRIERLRRRFNLPGPAGKRKADAA